MAAKAAKVIVNPAAGQGNSGKIWPEVEARLRAALGPIDIAVTASAGEETSLARQALADGYSHFIAVGGDGTMNGVLNGVMGDGAPANSDVRLSVIPAGTANELARAVGVHGDLDGAVNGIAAGREQRFDLLQAGWAGPTGGGHRPFGGPGGFLGGGAGIGFRAQNNPVF